MKKIIEAVEGGIKNVLAHESLQAANSAITLQALRMGGKGYDGEYIQVPLRAMARDVAKAVFEYVSYDLDLKDIETATAEERRKGVVEMYMEQYDIANGVSSRNDPQQSQQDKGLDFE